MDRGQENNKPILTETTIKRVPMAHPRRPFLNLSADKKLMAAATGIAALSIAAANLGAPKPPTQTPDMSFRAVPEVTVQNPSPKESPGNISVANEFPQETVSPENYKIDSLKIGELNTINLPTERVNGIVTIKINKDKDFPTPRTSTDIKNPPYQNSLEWSNIGEINGIRIDQAVNSNGQSEIKLENPLISRGFNPDTGKNDGIWITVVSDGKPLYISASQRTIDYVTLTPSGGSVFENVSPEQNVLDFGKVTIESITNNTAVKNPHE